MNTEISKQISSLIKQPDYRPMNKSEFARAIGVPSKERSLLRKVLSDLVDKGDLELGKKSRYYIPGNRSSDQTYEGVIQFINSDKRTMGSFMAEDPGRIPVPSDLATQGIFVGRRGAANAIDGDRVAVKILKKQPARNQGRRGERNAGDANQFEAVVVDILQRNLTTFVGTYHRKGNSAVISPENNRLPAHFHLREVLPEARPGDLVVAEFLNWANTDRPPSARMTEALGQPDDPGVDMLTVIHRYRLPLRFPHEVISEADAIDDHISENDLLNREDWRDREVFTIDPEDARDFDDAISVIKRPGDEGWELAVHIADVSHYVKPGTALDKEARKRGNSVYLADRVIPMIPEKLSNGVCSLNPNVDRLTHATVITFDSRGNMKKARFVSAVINSCRRYTYEEAYTRLTLSDEAAAEFDDRNERSVVAHMRQAWQLAELLRKKRFKEGCFDMDFPEVRVILDADGIAFGIKKTEHDESHQLIEEFMLAANEAVARETRNEAATSIYRVHEAPDPEKLQEFAELARSFGHRIGDPTIRTEIQNVTRSLKGKPEEHSVKLALLKSMKRAAYSNEPIGHYGLAKDNYSHFTSPIRRYADLIAHRSIKKIMSRRKEPTAPTHPDKTPNEAGAAEISSHISRTERVAADAERDSQQLKMIEYLENLLKEDSAKIFDAMVTDIRPIGVFIELTELMIKGLIRKTDLPSGKAYYLDKGQSKFISAINSKQTVGITDPLKVQIIRIDKSRGFLDFQIAE